MQSDLRPKGYGFHILKQESPKSRRVPKICVLFFKYWNQKNNVVYNILKEMHQGRKDKQRSMVSMSPLLRLIIHKRNPGERE